jgi:uncharacterized protein (TIGR03435 family)
MQFITPIRSLACTLLGSILLLPAALGQQQLGQQKFQVATIKPSPPDTPKHTQIRGNTFATSGTTVEDLLKFAYNIHVSQILGGPPWVRTEPFDILADPEMDRRPTLPELKAMTGELLAERFHLVLAREKRELPVFALRKTNAPPKMKIITADPTAILSGALLPPGNLYVHHATVSDFVNYLGRYAPPELNRPIVDQTGISGLFEFELHFTPEGPTAEDHDASSVSATTAPPEIFTAIQDQLGLKLVATKAAVEVLNITSITPPTPN